MPEKKSEKGTAEVSEEDEVKTRADTGVDSDFGRGGRRDRPAAFSGGRHCRDLRW